MEICEPCKTNLTNSYKYASGYNHDSNNMADLCPERNLTKISVSCQKCRSSVNTIESKYSKPGLDFSKNKSFKVKTWTEILLKF